MTRINLNEDTYCFDVETSVKKENVIDLIEKKLKEQYEYRKTDKKLWASVYENGNEISRWLFDAETKTITLSPLFSAIAFKIYSTEDFLEYLEANQIFRWTIKETPSAYEAIISKDTDIASKKELFTQFLLNEDGTYWVRLSKKDII